MIKSKISSLNSMLYTEMKELRKLWIKQKDLAPSFLERRQYYKNKIQTQILKDNKIDIQQVKNTKQLISYNYIKKNILQMVAENCSDLKEIYIYIQDMDYLDIVSKWSKL